MVFGRLGAAIGLDASACATVAEAGAGGVAAGTGGG